MAGTLPSMLVLTDPTCSLSIIRYTDSQSLPMTCASDGYYSMSFPVNIRSSSLRRYKLLHPHAVTDIYNVHYAASGDSNLVGPAKLAVVLSHAAPALHNMTLKIQFQYTSAVRRLFQIRLAAIDDISVTVFSDHDIPWLAEFGAFPLREKLPVRVEDLHTRILTIRHVDFSGVIE